MQSVKDVYNKTEYILRVLSQHWRSAATEVLVLKQQVEDLKKVVAQRVPVADRDSLLKAAADRFVWNSSFDTSLARRM
jgi:hypothetical protein